MLLPLLGYSQSKTKYFEFNTGFSTGEIPFFPGASALYGATQKYESGFLLDYEAGIAFPTLVTFKGGIGYDFSGTEVSVGVRPWPPTSYAQIRLDRPKRLADIVFTAEGSLFPNDLVQMAVFTIGWRFDNSRYKDIKQNKK